MTEEEKDELIRDFINFYESLDWNPSCMCDCCSALENSDIERKTKLLIEKFRIHEYKPRQLGVLKIKKNFTEQEATEFKKYWEETMQSPIILTPQQLEEKL